MILASQSLKLQVYKMISKRPVWQYHCWPGGHAMAVLLTSIILAHWLELVMGVSGGRILAQIQSMQWGS